MHATKKQARALFNELDENGGGFVLFDEFCHFCVALLEDSMASIQPDVVKKATRVEGSAETGEEGEKGGVSEVVSVKLGMDFPQGPEEQEAFKTQFVADVAEALGVDSSVFVVQSLTPGSVIVALEIKHKESAGGVPASSLKSQLLAQAGDQESKLYQGELTQHVKDVKSVATNRSPAQPSAQPSEQKSEGPAKAMPGLHRFKMKRKGSAAPAAHAAPAPAAHAAPVGTEPMTDLVAKHPVVMQLPVGSLQLNVGTSSDDDAVGVRKISAAIRTEQSQRQQHQHQHHQQHHQQQQQQREEQPQVGIWAEHHDDQSVPPPLFYINNNNKNSGSSKSKSMRRRTDASGAARNHRPVTRGNKGGDEVSRDGGGVGRSRGVYKMKRKGHGAPAAEPAAPTPAPAGPSVSVGAAATVDRITMHDVGEQPPRSQYEDQLQGLLGELVGELSALRGGTTAGVQREVHANQVESTSRRKEARKPGVPRQQQRRRQLSASPPAPPLLEQERKALQQFKPRTRVPAATEKGNRAFVHMPASGNSRRARASTGSNQQVQAKIAQGLDGVRRAAAAARVSPAR
jgi:hypothetical protein